MRWHEECDVLVAGFGMTGGAAVRALAGTASVLVLDRGAPLDAHAAPAERGPLLQAEPTLMWHNGHENQVSNWWNARMMGGGAHLWYGQLSRFSESDFAPLHTRADTRGLPGAWPVTLKDLAPWYRRVEAALLPWGSSYGHTPEAYRQLDCEIYQERRSCSTFETSAIDALHAHGLRAYVGQTCLGGRAWEQQPVDPGDDDAITTAAPLRVRRTWLFQPLPGNVEVRAHTSVACILTEGGVTTGAEVVTKLPDGTLQTRRIKATTVILAAGVLETYRILASSKVADHCSHLGSNFTFTLERVAYGLTSMPRDDQPTERARGTYANVVLKDLYEDLAGDGGLKGGKFALYDSHNAELPGRAHGYLAGLGISGEVWDKQAQERLAVKISYKGESLPWEHKRLELGTRLNSWGQPQPAIRYRPHPSDLLAQDVLPSVIQRIGRALGSAEVWVTNAPTGTALISAHQHGGAIAATHPDRGVVSTDCEVFASRGTFVVDASFMPTSGGTNSTHTAMANAMRVAALVSARF